MVWIVLIIIALFMTGLFFLMWNVSHRRTLSSSASARIHALIEKANRLPDPVLRILEYDKVLDQLLSEMHFQGTTGEKLIKAGPRFKNKEAIWKAHKLRNVVAHQSGVTASAAEADRFRDTLVQALQQVS